jgi:guanylate kinase
MYDYIVINRNIEKSLATLKAIIIAFKHSALMQKKAMERILNSEKES